MITTGFLGALTTYSSLSLETIHLLKSGQFILAFTYVTISIILGFIFVALGYKKGTEEK